MSRRRWSLVTPVKPKGHHLSVWQYDRRGDGWGWRCSCGAGSDPGTRLPSRQAARDQFAAHRTPTSRGGHAA
jgi:hypothetical protein